MADILVIDDDKVTLTLVEELLRDRGHTVRTAGNGVEGLTGYLFMQGEEALSIVLELDPEWVGRPEQVAANARSTLGRADISVPVVTVAQLPVTTKSGASLKNWKRSNFAKA